MKRTMNKKKFFAPSAWRLGGAARRAATALLLCVMTMTVQTAWAENVQTYYIDENGTRHDVNATVLTGTGVLTANQWYVVNSDVTISSGRIYSNGNINLILADGKTFTISSNHTDGIICTINGTLSIYGQENGTGTLNVAATGNSGNAIFGNSSVNIVGCRVSATSTGGAGISSVGNITISGGQVSATGGNGNYGLRSSGTITLGWRKTTDYVYASSYDVFSTVKVKDGQAFKDSDGNIYVGTLDNSQINGKTLTPATQTEYIQCFLGTGNDGSAEHPYTISDANGWIAFCLALDDNATWNHFSGKTVKLGANITVTQMAGGSNHAFTGIFDGDGHTLTLNYGNVQAPIDAEFVAPFVEVSGGATFINLNIDGHIYAAYTGSSEPGVGGLIGHLFGGITIEGCTSTVEINSTKDRVGGFVGLCEHAVTFTDCKSSAVVTCTGSSSGFVGWSRASEYTIAFYGCLFNGKVLKKNGVGSGNGGFLGWKGYHKTVKITNCLVDPAAVAEGETMADDNSATFCRYSADTSLDNQATSITNCYYTETFGNAQGTQAYSITAGDYVTTLANAGTVSNNYTTSGLIFYNVGLKYGDVLYAAENDVVSLTLGCTYYCTGYTATAGILNGTTLTMPNGNVTINATLTPIISYIDENGETQQCTNYTLLTGTETTLGTSGQETWYVADGTLNYGQTITLSGNVHLILKDNAVMNVGTEETPINGHGIAGNHSISIYAQSMGESQGQLHLNVNADDPAQYCGIIAQNSSITINGGEVEAIGASGIYASVNINSGKVTAFGSNGYGIIVENDNVTINGGQMSANNIIVLDGSITINGGQVTANDINANGGSVTINGGQVTVNSIVAYVGNITLGWSNASDFIFASSYSVIEYGTLSIAEGKAFIDEAGNTFESGTIDASAINGKTLYPYIEGSVPYIDENGQRQLCTQYTIFDGQTTLGTGWYVADGTHYYGQTITINGNVHLILKDNAVMNVGLEEDPIPGHGIHVDRYSFSIYAQSTGESQGQLHVIAGADPFSDSDYNGIYAEGSSITINGGKVTVNGIYYSDIYIDNGSVTINGGQVYADDIYSNNEASVTINGGQVTAGNIDAPSGVTINGGQVTANHGGINAIHGNIKLGWTNPTDFIHANSYLVDGGTLSIAEGKAFINAEGDIYESGTVNASDINGKTLRPYSNSMLFLADDADNTAIISKFNGQQYNVTLAGRTLFKDGAWNTLCLPFDVVVGSGQMEGATAMTLNGSTSGFNASTGVLTLNFDNVAQNSTIEAGTPFIVKWTGTDVTNPVFSGVTVSSTAAGSVLSKDRNVRFQGTYDKLEYTTEDKSILFLGEANTLYWPQPSGENIPTIGAFRAYFHVDLNGGANAVRSFVLNFGDSSESTGIREIDTDPPPTPPLQGWGEMRRGTRSTDGSSAGSRRRAACISIMDVRS